MDRRQSVVWALALGLLLVTAAAGCGAGHGAGAGGIVFEDGRIGPLRMNRSDQAEVIAFAGRPDVKRRAVEYDSTPYVALGYDCSSEPNDDAFPVLETPASSRNGPYCRTVFWISRRTGRLGDFFTASPRFSESHGVRIGMPTAKAERLLHKLVYMGCEADLHLGALTVAFTGGSARKLTRSTELHLVGGHVYAFALHGGPSDIGIFDCL
jgi:hypothetical protein